MLREPRRGHDRERGFAFAAPGPGPGSRCASPPASSSPASIPPGSSSWPPGSCATAAGRSASWWARSRLGIGGAASGEGLGGARLARRRCSRRRLLTAGGGLIAAVAVREGPFPFPRARFDPRRGRTRASRIAACGSPASATSGTCGSSTRCGPGSWCSCRQSRGPRWRGRDDGRRARHLRRDRGRARRMLVGRGASDRWGRTTPRCWHGGLGHVRRHDRLPLRRPAALCWRLGWCGGRVSSPIPPSSRPW